VDRAASALGHEHSAQAGELSSPSDNIHPGETPLTIGAVSYLMAP
jgi:hypothetical protein